MVSKLPIFETPSDRIFRTPDGARSSVWLRCVSGLHSTNACCAHAYGSASSGTCSFGTIGVAPCFLIG